MTSTTKSASSISPSSVIMASLGSKTRSRAYRVAARNTCNKGETRYAEYLELRKRAGDIIDYKVKPMSIRLAPRTFFEVDFLVIDKEGFLEIHDYKGHMEDDALVKLKVLADQYWFLRVFVVKEPRRGTYAYQEILPNRE